VQPFILNNLDLPLAIPFLEKLVVEVGETTITTFLSNCWSHCDKSNYENNNGITIFLQFHPLFVDAKLQKYSNIIPLSLDKLLIAQPPSSTG
jgi:hypothetical protein